MPLTLARAVPRRPSWPASAVLLGLVLSLLGLQFVTSQSARAADDPAPTLPRWTMLVSDAYDGSGNYPPDPMRCLSTNGATSTSGAGTHSVYLATCNPDAPGQWWRLLSTTERDESRDFSQLRNLQKWEGVNWCLSANGVTPSGGFSGTHGVYTSKCSSTTEGQQWSPYHQFWLTNTYSFQNKIFFNGDVWEMSTSEFDPYPGGVYQVFNVKASTAREHKWRLYAPQSPPDCSTCGL